MSNKHNSMDNQIVEFTKTYHQALEKRLDELGRENFPYHKEPSKSVIIFKCSDGFATFYLPEQLQLAGTEKYFLKDCSTYDLDTVCQSVSDHHLKIIPPHIGEPVHLPIERTPDIQLIEELKFHWLSKDIIQAIEEKKVNALPELHISPHVYHENNVRKKILPYKNAIWSPTHGSNQIGITRVHLWTHLDLWWLPGEINFNALQPEILAKNDVAVLKMLLNEVGGLNVSDASKDPADELLKQCDEFQSLIEEHGDNEEVIHQWLKDPKHRFFLEPDPIEVYSKVPFGSNVSDFVVKRSDGTYILVEIEKPNEEIFRKGNSEPTHTYNHACQQVKDWQRYIRDNVHTVRSEQNFPGIDSPKGIVIIGRNKDIQDEKAKIRWRDMKNSGDIMPFTYDEICERVKMKANMLKNIIQNKSMVIK